MVVDQRGIEPLTSRLRSGRSPGLSYRPMASSRELAVELSDEAGVTLPQAAVRAPPAVGLNLDLHLPVQTGRALTGTSRSSRTNASRLECKLSQAACNSARKKRKPHARRTGAACWCREMEVWVLDKSCADPLCVSRTTLSLLRSGADRMACSAAGEGNDPSASWLPRNLAWFPPTG
jgi:hypothetical protein